MAQNSKDDQDEEIRLRAMLSTREAREYVWSLMHDFCGLFSGSYRGNGTSDDTIYLEGQRTVGLKLYHDIQTHCPEVYVCMMKEANGE